MKMEGESEGKGWLGGVSCGADVSLGRAVSLQGLPRSRKESCPMLNNPQSQGG